MEKTFHQNCLEIISNSENKIFDFVKAGEYLLRNGSPSFGAYCICSGKIELIYKNDEGFFIKIIKNSGDIFGEDNLESHYYIFDALALEDSQICFIDKNYYLNELDEYHDEYKNER